MPSLRRIKISPGKRTIDIESHEGKHASCQPAEAGSADSAGASPAALGRMPAPRHFSLENSADRYHERTSPTPSGGFNDHLTRPVSGFQLLAQVDRILPRPANG